MSASIATIAIYVGASLLIALCIIAVVILFRHILKTKATLDTNQTFLSHTKGITEVLTDNNSPTPNKHLNLNATTPKPLPPVNENQNLGNTTGTGTGISN